MLPDTARRGAGVKLLLATYFGELRENVALAVSLPVDALHVDVTRAERELGAILAGIPAPMILSLGIVDGRNIWRNDFDRSCRSIDKARNALGAARVWLAPSCSLIHSPVSLRRETALDAQLKEWLAFAEEKLIEVVALASLGTGKGDPLALHKNQLAIQSRRVSERIHRAEVKTRSASVTDGDGRGGLPLPSGRSSSARH